MSMSNKLEAAKVLQVTSLEELTKALEEASAKNLAILPGSQRDLPKDAAKQLKGKTGLFLDLSKMDHVLEHCL